MKIFQMDFADGIFQMAILQMAIFADGNFADGILALYHCTTLLD